MLSQVIDVDCAQDVRFLSYVPSFILPMDCCLLGLKSVIDETANRLGHGTVCSLASGIRNEFAMPKKKHIE